MGWPGPLTHRQFRVWQLWEDAQWNEMTKEDYYLAQIAAVLHRVNSSRRGKNVKVTDYKITFGKKTISRVPSRTDVAASKAKWVNFVGGKEKVKFHQVEPPEGSSPSEKRKLVDPENTDGF